MFDCPRPGKGDATVALQRTIDRAARWGAAHPADTVVVALAPNAVYNISREKSTREVIHVSNTASPQENPDPTKHIGLLFRAIDRMVFDGRGARIITHGEMTPWVVDGCTSITLKDFSIDAADPSVAEMTVVESGPGWLTAEVNPLSSYEIADGRLWWTGEGWRFTDGIAQVFSPADSTTLRTWSPTADAVKAEPAGERRVRLTFADRRHAVVGTTFQSRHSIRNEVAGLISCSRGVELSGISFNFMGNFGVVAQTSRDITYRRLTCAPATELTGRTCAGFADFLQVSGCGGQVTIEDCRFAGAHDDPINVHGTHLAVGRWLSPERVEVGYRHPQTFGFQSFFAGDSVMFVASSTLREAAPGAVAVVKEARMLGDHTVELTFTAPVGAEVTGAEGIVVENLSWCPDVRIARNTFTLTPTRGILITTRGRVEIVDNLFERIPMASVLIADDARSWYESGPVSDVTISGNRFVDCSLPVILVKPENRVDAGPVHGRVEASGNEFEFTASSPFAVSGSVVDARSVGELKVTGNRVIPAPDSTIVTTTATICDKVISE